MTRRYGRSQVGTRLLEKTPCGRWQTTTFLGALGVEGFIAPSTVEGPINGPLFRGWLEQRLAPVLQRGDLVVMDNLSSHKVVGVREAIEAVGAELRYLPPYSPDLNPIEFAFSKLKSAYVTELREQWTSSGDYADASLMNLKKPSAEIISNTADTATPNL